ncbi:MAG: hypothetical protein WDN67_02300 [Candidatus Moraniibacteriota bacterium]
MKKVFFSSLALLILALIFLAAYNFAFRNNVSTPKSGDGAQKPSEASPTTPADENTSSVSSEVSNPVNEAVLAPVTSSDGTLYYYSVDDKALKKATLEGKDKAVLLNNLPGTPERVLWSPKRDKILLLIGGHWYFSDIANKTLVDLKEGIINTAWNSLGDKIFYIYRDPSGAQSVNTANPDGSNWQALSDLPPGGFFLANIPQTPGLSLWKRPSAPEKTLFERITPGGSPEKLFEGPYGADYLWAPSGDKVAISSSNGPGGESLNVSLIDKQGGGLRSLAIPTLVSKLAWSRDGGTLYFALPGGLPQGTVLPNDYFGKGLKSRDTFWKIDVTTNKKTRLLDTEAIGQDFDSSDLFLSPKEDALFFTDRTTKKLYRIDL